MYFLKYPEKKMYCTMEIGCHFCFFMLYNFIYWVLLPVYDVRNRFEPTFQTPANIFDPVYKLLLKVQMKRDIYTFKINRSFCVYHGVFHRKYTHFTYRITSSKHKIFRNYFFYSTEEIVFFKIP